MKSTILAFTTRYFRLPAFTLVLSALLFRGSTVPSAIPQTYGTPLPVQRVIIQDELVYPSLDTFADLLRSNGAYAGAPADQVIGVYVPDVLALPVVQQPQDQPYFVSTDPEVVTQFRMALQGSTIGLLAHNTLAGAHFSGLAANQKVSILFADGTVKNYLINEVKRYKALQPESPFSNFQDLEHPDQTLASSDVFQQIFTQGDRVIFQTCIANEGNPSWGRMFVIATPVAP